MSKRAREIERERDLDKEYLVKAAMLIKIHEQVTWPEALEKKSSRPGLKRKSEVNICVIGKNPFPPKAQEVFKLASNDKVQYKLIVSDKLTRRVCHVLFIADDPMNDVDAIIQKLRSTPTLTISDMAGFARKGGCIEFFLYANRVIKLLINERATLEKGLAYGPAMYDKKIGQVVRKKH